jgi:lysophospholipase L1-like esterase
MPDLVDPTRRALITAPGLAALAAVVPSVAHARPTNGPRWQGSWGRALVRNAAVELIPAGSTYREVLPSSIPGEGVRIVLSNEAGEEPLTIAGATLRIDATGAHQTLRFGGLPSIAVPPGATVTSDPVRATIRAGGQIEVGLHFAVPTPASTIERRAKPTGAWLATGDRMSPTLSGGREVAPLFVKSLEVSSSTARPVLIVLSDTKSAGPETWVPMLAQRAAGRLGVVNRSVLAGHLALGPAQASALARFDRDVIATSGATHVLIFAGNNDLIQPGMTNGQGRMSLDPALTMSVEQLTAMLAQAVGRARAAGLVAVGGTWTPYEGVTIANGYSTPEKIAKRQAVNDWIRRRGSFDMVVDFDAALRDPQRMTSLAARFDEGNHFTPNAAGYAAMADVILAAMVGRR